jgi:hypothetical protein
VQPIRQDKSELSDTFRTQMPIDPADENAFSYLHPVDIHLGSFLLTVLRTFTPFATMHPNTHIATTTALKTSLSFMSLRFLSSARTAFAARRNHLIPVLRAAIISYSRLFPQTNFYH